MAKKDKQPPVNAGKDKGKDKKDKKANGAPAAPAGTAAAGTPGAQSVPLSSVSPDQMTAAQLEQAIKESNDPNNKLKKLRSPLNLRSCLINILVLVLLTFAVVLLWVWKAVDKFSFTTIMSDMMDKFGITEFFANIGKTIGGWFGG